MNIIQQILSLSTDFFNTNLEAMVTGQASLTDVTLAVQEFVQNLGREVLSAMLEQADEAIYETVKPQRTYQIKETARSRTLVTTFGEITFHRRYYRQKDTGRYTYLLDEWCQLPAYSRIEASCQARMADHAKDMSYAKAAQVSTPVPVSKQSVRNVLCRLGTIPNTAAPLPERRPKVSELFIEADEDHVAMQQGNNRQLRLAYVYEGKVAEGKKRRTLTAKRVFTGYGMPWKEIKEYIQTVYDSPEITILGDGAAWIQSATSYLEKSRCVTDGFHVVKYLRQIAGTETIQPLYDALLANDREQFCREAEQKIRHRPYRRKAIRRGQQYILNHWEGIRDWLQNRETFASSTEGHVSHILSARLSSRGMGWSKDGAERIARLRTLAENGGDVWRYALDCLTKKPSDTVPDLNSQELTRQCRRQRLPYCVYDAEHSCRMPGSEGALHGRWMKDIQNSGYHHIH